MEFNLRNNDYSTKFKNKPKFKPISYKLFSNEKLKKDFDFIKFGLQKRDKKTSNQLYYLQPIRLVLELKKKKIKDQSQIKTAPQAETYQAVLS